MSKFLIDKEEYYKIKEENNNLKEKYKSIKLKYEMYAKIQDAKSKENTDNFNKELKTLVDKLSDLSKENKNIKKQNKEFNKVNENLIKEKVELEKTNNNHLITIDKLKTDLSGKNIEIKELIEQQNKTLKEFENTKIELNEVKKLKNYKKEGISICLTAWKTQDYIEECLDSIENQTYFTDFNDYEILLGIDGCKETLEKVKQIQHKYRNLRVFMMDHNVGTYITTNTVMSIAQYDWFLRFDTDDIMNPEMIKNVMKNVGNNIILKCSFQNFGKKLLTTYKRDTKFAHGVIAFNRNVFYDLGGYKPWQCSGDSDFIERASQFGYSILEPGYNYVYFKRRVHEDSLSLSKDTLLSKDRNRKNGVLREKYKQQIKIDLKNGIIKIDTVTEKYTEIK